MADPIAVIIRFSGDPDGEGLHARIRGMGIEPAEIERLRIAKLGLD